MDIENKTKVDLKGFTTLELIIVLSIIGILSSLSGFALYRGFPRYKLNIAARQIVSQMQSMRIKSIIKRARYGIIFENNDKGSSSSFFSFKDINKNSFFDAQDTIEIEKSSLSSVKVKANFNRPHRNTLVFRENGTAKGGNVCLTSSKEEDMKIIVNIITGRIRVENKCS